jgi:hypothetical protein
MGGREVMNAFLGVTIRIVEHGAEIGKDKNGNPMVVTDSNVVFKGGTAWVTKATYDKIKEATR